MEVPDRDCQPLMTGAWTCPLPGMGLCGIRESVNGSVSRCGDCVLQLLSRTNASGSCALLWWNEVQLILATGVEVDRRLRENYNKACRGRT